jgi:putative ABC transport system permease protein
MSVLNDEHIAHIIKDLNHRGIMADNVRDELIDHICSAVEEEMIRGSRFLDAYRKVLKSFGHNTGLRTTQNEILRVDNKTTKLMLKNYLTIALRNLNKHRFFTFINVSGLSIGIASCLIIILYVLNEFSYDKHYKNASRIYRTNGEIKFGGNHWKLAVGPAPLAAALLNEFPEVENVVRFRSQGSYLVKAEGGTTSIKEYNVNRTDSTFFKVFSVPVLEGDPNSALSEPNSVAVSKSIATKYYPEGNALGKILILDNATPVKITAIYEDMPSTGHFRFDLLVSMTGFEEAESTNFLSNNFNTYILLKEGTDAKQLEAKLPALVVKYIGPQAAAVLGGEFSMEKFRESGNILEYTLMPMTDIHLHSDRTAELAPNSDVTYVYLFLAIAVFILFIACINFMNLSTARSANRAKEVGVRKVMGSLRSHLVRQFLTESILLSVFSFLLAVGLAYAMLPIFNSISQKTLTLPFGDLPYYAILILAALIVGVLAGLYPSFFLSAFKPVNVLKGNVALGMKSGRIRSALVIFQFVISILLVIGTFTVNRQLNYIQNKKIGFEKDQVIVIKDAYALGKNLQAFKSEITRNSFIESGTISGYLPVSGTWRNDNTFWPEGTQPTEENMVGLQNWAVDYDYLKTLGIQIKAGRFFSEQFPSDSNAIVMNEAAVKQFNLDPNPLGKKISTFDGVNPDGSPDRKTITSYTVVGVVENFHFESLKQNISALAFFLEPSNGNVAFRFKASNTQEVISTIENTWSKLAPGQPFQYSFLDEDFGRMYSSEQRLGKIFVIFASLAIVIACLGLFALTSFTAEQRTKEIGIRKVLGASVGSIVLLLSKEFGKLIVVAFLIAVPLAWYGVSWWLDNYVYKVEVGVLVYVLAGLVSFLVAWATMGYQSIKAAMSNPVNSLRSE